MQLPKPSQRARLLILLAEVVLLLAVGRVIHGQWLPPATGEGFWFSAALLGLVLGSRLDTPHFVVPADVLLYTVPAAVAMLLETGGKLPAGPGGDAFTVALTYCVGVAGLAAVAILAQTSEAGTRQRISGTAKVLAEHLGTPVLVYTGVLLFALLAYHSDNPRSFIAILLVWVILCYRPLDRSIDLWRRLLPVFNRDLPHISDGEVVAFHAPNVVHIRANADVTLKRQAVLGLRDAGGAARAVLILDEIGSSEGTLWRALELSEIRNDSKLRAHLVALRRGCVSRISLARLGLDRAVKQFVEGLVGLVAQESSVQEIFFDIVCDEGVEEGRLVRVRYNDNDVMYQIVNGLTREEIVDQRARLGYVRGQARKVGTWDPEKHRFMHAKWIPQMNSPVFLENVTTFSPDIECVGHFPHTNYGVKLRAEGTAAVGLNMIVTHNTAILGILGVGKSSLAIELIERMLVEDVRVVCVDLTNQYAKELTPYYDDSIHTSIRQWINSKTADGHKNVAKSKDDGGSRQKLAECLRGTVKKLMAGGWPIKLLVLNPAEIVAWKQDSNPYKDEASMSQLTPAEVTHQITDAALAAVTELGMTDQARLCLVFEEAHTLVPEWNSAVHEGDKSASNGTARAILQGRKYGLGCLLISQRTANVTKTILNQCNTVFAMRTFDDTGKEFLANYLGGEFSRILPTLEERQAVFFGRGSSCENPVLLRLNDRPAWVAAFRQIHPPPPLAEAPLGKSPAEPAQVAEGH